MIDNGADALEHALELHAMPGSLPLLRRRPLPDAVLLLIRIAAGDRQAIQTATVRTSATTRALTDAAVNYLRQVLFDTHADHYRLLGVRAEDGEDAFREHYRWLMRWLHPDRDPDHLGESEAQRVNRAWHVLRSGERRLAYDRQLALQAERPSQPSAQPSTYRHAAARTQPQPLLSPRTVHHLPVLVLGGMALLAGGSLAGWHWLEQISDTNVAISQGHRPDARSLARSPVAAVAATIAARRVAYASHAVDASAMIARQADPQPDARMQTTSPAARITSDESRPAAQMSDASAIVEPSIVPRTQTIAAMPDRAEDSAERTVDDRSDATRDYEALADQFVAAYAQGDIDRMMGLFAPDAADDHGGVATIAGEYERLFRLTRSRRLRLGPFAWTPQGDGFIGTGSFDARVRRHGHLYARHMHGRIQLEVAPVDDQWKIRRISLQEDQR